MRGNLVRWNLLLKEYLKRDSKLILLWVAGLAVFSGGFVPAFEEIGKGQGLRAMYETMKNPAMIAIAGPIPVDTTKEYTLGAFYSHEMLLFCGLFAMIVTALHVVNHTRREEEQGLTELVRSYRVGRWANSFAVIIEILIIHLLLGMITGALIAIFQIDTITTAGSFLFGASVAGAGILGGAIALLVSQLFPMASGATGTSLGVIGALYLLRGMTDVSNLSLSRLNPMSWIYLTAPFTQNKWQYLAALLFCSAVLVFAAFGLESRRDLGAGYIRTKEGKAHAGKSLLSVHGLLLHLNKKTIIGWLAGFAVLGAAYGSIYGDMQMFLQSNDLIRQLFSLTGNSVEASFTAVMMQVISFMVAILPVVILQKTDIEERQGRFIQIYATKTGRGKLYGTSVIIAALSGVAGIIIASLSLGGVALSVMKEDAAMNLSDFMEAGGAYGAVILFVAGISAFLLGWLPALLKFVYVYLGYSFALSYFGELLQLPWWFLKTSVLSWAAKVPLEAFRTREFVLVLTVAVLLIVAGQVGYRRRDLREE